MIEYKGYNIPEKNDLKTKGIVVPIGDNLMVMLGKDVLFDTGFSPSKVYEITEEEFNKILYSRATGYIDTVLRTED